MFSVSMLRAVEVMEADSASAEMEAIVVVVVVIVDDDVEAEGTAAAAVVAVEVPANAPPLFSTFLGFLKCFFCGEVSDTSELLTSSFRRYLRRSFSWELSAASASYEARQRAMENLWKVLHTNRTREAYQTSSIRRLGHYGDINGSGSESPSCLFSLYAFFPFSFIHNTKSSFIFI